MINITFTIEEALDLVVKYKEFATVDKELADKFKVDTEEQYCHIEELEAGKLYKLYRRRDWLDSCERLEKVRKASEESRQLAALKENARNKLFSGVKGTTLGMLPDKDCWALVNSLIAGARVNASGLEHYGLSKEEIARLL